MLTTLASLSVDGLQRIGDIALTPDSYVLFVHQFEDGMLFVIRRECGQTWTRVSVRTLGNY